MKWIAKNVTISYGWTQSYANTKNTGKTDSMLNRVVQRFKKILELCVCAELIQFPTFPPSNIQHKNLSGKYLNRA